MGRERGDDKLYKEVCDQKEMWGIKKIRPWKTGGSQGVKAGGREGLSFWDPQMQLLHTGWINKVLLYNTRNSVL